MPGKWYMAKAASKKLANAFGKAVQHPEATPEGRKLVYESKTIKNMPGDYSPTDLDSPAQRAFKAGRYQGDENYELSRDAINNRYSGEDRDVRKAVAGQEVDAMESSNADYRLQDEFDKAFDEAVSRRNYETDYDKADRLFTGRRANESAQRFDEMFPDHWKATDEEREPMLRTFMIEELKRGTPIEDVIYLQSKLRRTGPID